MYNGNGRLSIFFNVNVHLNQIVNLNLGYWKLCELSEKCQVRNGIGWR